MRRSLWYHIDTTSIDRGDLNVSVLHRQLAACSSRAGGQLPVQDVGQIQGDAAGQIQGGAAGGQREGVFPRLGTTQWM